MRKGRVARVVASAAMVAGVGVGMLAQAAPAFADTYSPGDAAAFVADINALRAAHGVGPLSVNSSLVGMADNWAVHLSGVGSLSHNPGLASLAPAGWRLLGENVGVGASVSALQAAFTASPEHYANMVDGRFTEIGVGVYVTSQGYMWATEDYMEPPAVAPAAAPAAPAPRPAPTPAPAPSTVSVRPVALSTPVPAPVHAAPVAVTHPAPVAAPVTAASTPVPTAVPTPVVTHAASVATPSTPPASAPTAPASPGAKRAVVPLHPATPTRPVAHHSLIRVPSMGLSQLLAASARSLSPARAAAMLLLPLAGLAWLMPRRRPGLAGVRRHGGHQLGHA